MGQKIEKFGNRQCQRVEIFLYQLELSLYNKTEEAAKVSELVMSLKGQPLKWMFETMKGKQNQPSFKELAVLLIAQYAKRKTTLCVMTPGMTPVEYVDLFDEALADVGTVDELKSVEFFNNGIDAKYAAFMHTARCTTLEVAKELFLKIATAPISNTVDENGIMAFRSTLSKLTDEERAKCFKEGRCFKCRQQGHVSREFPGKPKNLKGKGQH